MNDKLSIVCPVFENYSDADQIKLMKCFLEEAGFDVIEGKRGKRYMAFCLGAGYVFSVGDSRCHEGGIGFNFIDRNFYDNRFGNNETSTFNFHKSNYKEYVRYYGGGCSNVPIHKLVMLDNGYDIPQGMEVDHKYSHPSLNDFDSLRVVTSKQNSRNRKDSTKAKDGSEFAYDPLEDFTYVWYAYVLHKFGMCTFQDVKDYNKDYRRRHGLLV